MPVAAAPSSTSGDGAQRPVNNGVTGVNGSALPSTQRRSVRAWYRGTWPQKSTASTQVARETILADKPRHAAVAADFRQFEPKESADGELPLGKSQSTSTVSVNESKTNGYRKDGPPNDVSARRQSDPVQSDPLRSDPVQSDRETEPREGSAASTNAASHSQSGNSPSSIHRSATTHNVQPPTTSSLWRNWLGYLVMEQTDTSQPAQDNEPSLSQRIPQEESSRPSSMTNVSQVETTAAPPTSTSWFRIWPTTSATDTMNDQSTTEDPVAVPSSPDNRMQAESIVVPARPPSGSTWAFWAKNSTGSISQPESRDEQGELAVAGGLSQNKPIPAHTSPFKATKDAKTARDGSLVGDVNQMNNSGSAEITPTTGEPIQRISQQDAIQTPTTNTTASKSSPPNLLLPVIASTYRLKDSLSIVQQLAKLLTKGFQEAPKHVHLIQDPPRIKKALAIGVHGLFPAPLLRTVIGQPTGTSIRFANHAADAITRWTDERGYVCGDIEKIALEGEGKIAERVDNLWKLLLNWIDHVRNADFIMLACHSQGVPVTLILVAKLIELGVVTTARIGVCAMVGKTAGVSLGPFADYKSRFFSGSAAELFELANAQSEIAKRYEESLRSALKYGVRVTYVGSIDDQLVSLESAVFSPVTHPYIYRAVFVDGRVHAPDFIVHLVGFALKLRNLGVSDHGLIRELSVPLAGSLYSGGGHSSLYNETRIYDLATAFTLETSSVNDVPLLTQKYDVPLASNPFQLPWSMRGLLEEDIVKKELNQEAKDLLRQFERWKPATKVLKDVKYRLEAVKSKIQDEQIG
ncbi:MAG: hypothetical protein M1818_006875 [Claussenomyces sp. TS43310]|nr:MAG: hypothetical protein M1818_006875 [Claussenomyces sp. TS43310]